MSQVCEIKETFKCAVQSDDRTENTFIQALRANQYFYIKGILQCLGLGFVFFKYLLIYHLCDFFFSRDDHYDINPKKVLRNKLL